MPTLLCTVRGCHLPLSQEAMRFVCPRAHSFDIARSGYCNLLQPQDSRSRQAGDSREAVAARRRFLERGFAAPLLDAIAAQLSLSPGDPLLDVGCGEGHHLGAFRERFACDAYGVDISVPAVDAAARRYRDCHWIVSNADRFLPYDAGSFKALTSITSRLNASEFRRVVRDDGHVVVALPGPDDLIELRERVLGEAMEIDRIERTRPQLESAFNIERIEHVRHVAHLDRDAIHDVMASSYRGLRSSQRERLESIAELDVTLSRDILVLRP